MDPASFPSYQELNPAWPVLRVVLGMLLLMLPIIAGMAVAAMRRGQRQVARPGPGWAPRRVIVPPPCGRRPWRTHRS